MVDYPSGTVAFLFTDIEGSTRRWETEQQAMHAAVEQHFALLRSVIEAHRGVLFKTIGDAVQAAFPSVPDAITAAAAAQTLLRAEDWGVVGPLRVRMAIHIGEAVPRDGDYLAPALNRLARVLATGFGDQVLLTEAAVALAGPAFRNGIDALDLGAHRLRDLLQPEHIYQLRGPGLLAEFPPLKSLDRHLHNLPAQPTALLGREEELAAAKSLLQQDGVRLVTLTGPGGSGKTRLGVQAGAELVQAFVDGVWFVPLAGSTEPELVILAIAHALGVREVPGERLQQTVQDYLRSKDALLLLDNFEHVTDAATDAAALLAACPKLKILVTSREPLRVAGEHELPVPPLPLPGAREVGRLTAADLLAYPAIRLFVERAQAIKPGFDLSDANAADVATICLRLDGLPLAIELAAARVRVLSPSQLLARLDNRLRLLTGGSRDLPARQQTLRAAIEWSHDLLSPDDQVLFARLSVFAGGCTLEAAEAVCAKVAGQTLDVLDGVESLAQKSLLREDFDPYGSPRFRCLETIREFAMERLEVSGSASAVRQAHASFYLDLAESAEPYLQGPDQVAWLDRLSIEHDNFRAALSTLEGVPDALTELRLAGALWRFWWVRGYLTEGRGWLERALVQSQDHDPAIAAKAFSGAGILAESQGDYDQAETLHDRALALSRKIGDRIGTASSLTNLGIIARIQGDHDRAAHLHERALAMWEEIGDNRGVASSAYELGVLALTESDWPEAERHLKRSLEIGREIGAPAVLAPIYDGLGVLAFYECEYGRAMHYYEEGLALWQALDDSRMVAHSLVNMAEAYYFQGDGDRAEALNTRALALFRELADRRGTAYTLAQIGKLALEKNDVAAAAIHFRESLTLRRHVGEKAAIAESLEGFAEVAAAFARPAEAGRLLGAASALREEIGAPLSESQSEAQTCLMDRLRTALGADDLAGELVRGRALSLDEAIAEAVAVRLFPSEIKTNARPPSLPGTLASQDEVG
jgi:predicted ATPase/class 3 adenylate cyclase